MFPTPLGTEAPAAPSRDVDDAAPLVAAVHWHTAAEGRLAATSKG